MDRTSNFCTRVGLVLLSCLSTSVFAHAHVVSPAANSLQGTDAAEEDYRYLAGLVERELWDLAVDAGQKFLRDHQGDERVPLARYRLASSLFSLQRHGDALPHWDQLGQRAGFEYRLEAEFRAGECSLVLGRPKQAAVYFTHVLDGDQTYLHQAAGFLLGEASFQAEDFSGAERAYAQHIQDFGKASTVPDARRARAWCAWEQADAAQTATRAREFLELHSRDAAAAEVGVLLGEALLEISDPKAALSTFRAFTEDKGHGDAALRGAGFALAALGQPAEAAQFFGQVSSRFPASSFARECRLQQGAQLVAAGLSAQAVKALAPLANAKDAEADLWYGRALAATGNARAAQAAFKHALKQQPSEDLKELLHVALGDAHSTLGELEAARDAYAQANSDFALHAAAVAALNAEDPRAAEEFAETLLKRGKEAQYRGPTLLVLGEARFAGERWEAAQAAFRMALEAAQDDAARSRSRSRIAWCSYMSGDLSAAASTFSALAREMPSAPEAEESARMAARALEESAALRPAAQAWRDYLKSYGEGAFVTEALIALARTTDRADERARCLARAADLDQSGNEGARALLNLAEDLAQSGDDEAAARFEDLLQRVTGKHPELEARARYGLAWCRFEEERFTAASELLEPLAEGRTLQILRGEDLELAGSALELLIWSLARDDKAQEAARILALLRAEQGALLPDDDRRFEATRSVAEAWMRSGEPKRGQALYEMLLGGLRSEEVALRCLVEGAYLSMEADDRDRAEAQLRTAQKRAERDPRILEACFFLAEARMAAGEEQRALALFQQAAWPESPLAADALYRSGFVQLSGDHNAEAEQLFAALVQQHAEHALVGEALFLLGEARFRTGEYTGAIDALERVRKEYPQHEIRPKALFRLGLSLGHAQRWDTAAEVLAILAKESPQFPNLAEAELWRGRSLAALSLARPARSALERVLKLDDGALAAEARVIKGNLLQNEGRFDDALSEYLKVAVLYTHPPAVSEAVYRAGLALEALKRPADAARRYAEVLQQHAASDWAAAAKQALERLDT